MASGPITSWEIDGETVETVSDLLLVYKAFGYSPQEIVIPFEIEKRLKNETNIERRK